MGFTFTFLPRIRGLQERQARTPSLLCRVSNSSAPQKKRLLSLRVKSKSGCKPRDSVNEISQDVSKVQVLTGSAQGPLDAMQGRWGQRERRPRTTP